MQDPVPAFCLSYLLKSGPSPGHLAIQNPSRFESLMVQDLVKLTVYANYRIHLLCPDSTLGAGDTGLAMPRSYLHDVQSSEAKPAVVQPTVMSNVRPLDTSLLPNLPLSVGPDARPAQASFRNTERCEEPWIRKKALGFPDS